MACFSWWWRYELLGFSIYWTSYYDFSSLGLKVIFLRSVHKAQLGCIECLALMICAELQSPELRKDFTSVNKIAGKSVDPGLYRIFNTVQAFFLQVRSKLTYVVQIAGNAVSRNCVLEHVVLHIVHDENNGISRSNLGCGISALHGPMLLSFCLCMVNVLISACQKISDFGKKPFAQNSLPVLIHSSEVFDFFH